MSEHLSLKDLHRLRQIVTILVEEGFSMLIAEMKLGWLTPLRCRVRCWLRRTPTCYPIAMGHGAVVAEFPVRLRRTLERLGPTFVKFGQMLSLRPDLLPDAYAQELRKLQDAVPPAPFDAIRARVEAEFGKPLRSLFRSFSEDPVGSASMAQVHEATIKSGERVAVKVLRPGVEDIVPRDVHLLLFLAATAEARVAALRRFRPLDVVREFSAWTVRELDLTKEAQAIDRFREIFRDDADVVIPAVTWERTTPRVLTMSFLDGVRADDHAALRRHRIDARAVARTCVRAALVQFFSAGFFHADPHPGNFVILPKGKLGLFDFGIVGRMDEEMRTRILRAIAAFVDHDTDRYLDEILTIAEVPEGADVTAFRRDARDALEQLYVPNNHRKRITAVVLTVIERAALHGIRFPTDFVLLGKALVTVEASELALDPRMDIAEEMAPFIRDLLARETKPARAVARAAAVATDWASLLAELPERTRALFAKFERGEIGVKIDLEELRDFKRELDRQNDIRVLAVVTVAVLLASAILLRLDTAALRRDIEIGKWGIAAGALLLLWFLRLLIRR